MPEAYRMHLRIARLAAIPPQAGITAHALLDA
jgi:hypothetical protein